MTANFRELSVLIVSDHDSNRKMLSNVMKVLGIQKVEVATDVVMGFRMFREGKHSFVLSELKDGRNDVVALAEFIRKDERSPNQYVPIISTAGPATKVYVDAARDAGVTEMIMAPYSVGDVRQMINYVMTESAQRAEIETTKYTGPDRRRRQDPSYMGPFRREGDELLRQSVERLQAKQEEAAKAQIKQPPVEQEWVGEDESQEMTTMLLDSFLKHHEIVFSKLQFAKDATQKSIDQIRQTYEDVKNRDASNILEFKNFDQMWEEIIEMFVAGGLGEDEIFKIEDIITTIPEDIKEHYDELSAQDKTFMTLVESLNMNAYKKAKQKVAELQAQPNIMSGMTKDDYQEVIDKAKKEESDDSKDGGGELHILENKKPEPAAPQEEKTFRYDAEGNLIG